jgi:hypothetical protein
VIEIRNLEDDDHLELVDIPIYEAAPSRRDQVMDVIGRLLSALDRDRVAR